MSNPTNYTVGGIDLSGIFQPLTSGARPSIGYDTGYKVNGIDIRNLFQPYLLYNQFLSLLNKVDLYRKT